MDVIIRNITLDYLVNIIYLSNNFVFCLTAFFHIWRENIIGII